MTGSLRSLLRVRFFWSPAVGLLFAVALLAVGGLPAVGEDTAVLAAGFVTVSAALAVGFVRSLFG